jgi:hypothetical protein
MNRPVRLRLVRRAASLAATACLVGAGLSLPAAAGAASCGPGNHVADGNLCDWVGTPSYVSGTWVYSRGEFIYSDYVHDDYGANVDGFRSENPDPPQPITGVYPNPQEPTHPWEGGTGDNGAERFRHTGDYGYPEVNLPGGATGYYDVADILEFREAVDHGQLHFLVKLGSMTAPDSTVIGICIDADQNAGTGAAMWPYGANYSHPLGCDYFVTLWGTGGTLIDYTKTPAQTTPIRVAANVKGRPPFIEADAPIPSGATLGAWRTYVGSGMWDASAHKWATAMFTAGQEGSPGSLGIYPNIYNVLFRPSEYNNWWRDTVQADDLAGGDISEDHADIDMQMLGREATGPRPQPTGLLNLQYRTIPLGNGQGEIDNGSVFVPVGSEIYKGPVEPYTMILPSDYYTQPHPRRFVFFYHCANCNQNIFPFGVEAAAEHTNNVYDSSLGTSHVQSIVDTSDILVGGALQRGEEGAGSTYGDIPGAGERDLRDIWSTMLRRDHWSIDRNRVIYSGMSMGGSTTETMMTLYPDELAAAVSYSAAFSSVSRDVNIRDVPWYEINGDTGLDSTAIPSGRPEAQRLDMLGYRHMYIEYLARAHDFNLVYESLPIVEQTGWREVRDPNPAEVTFERDASMEDRALGLIHDHAYWASRLELPKGAASATIDAIALPLAYKLPKMKSVLTGTFTNSITGNNAYVDWLVWNRSLKGHGLQDFEPGWTPDADVTVTDTKFSPTPHAGANGFSMTTSYAAETLDLGRMGIRTYEPTTGWIDTFGATSLTLLGRQLDLRASSVTVDGHPAAATRARGSITVAIPAGNHLLSLGVRVVRAHTRPRIRR